MKRMMKHVSALLCMLLMGLNLASCGGDSTSDYDDSQKVLMDGFSQSSLNFTAEQSSEQSFTFTAGSSWSITVSSNGGDTSWCNVYPISGEKGAQTVYVYTTANTSYDERNATITLKSGTQAKSIVVTQKQKNALLLTSDKYEVDNVGGSITVEVKSNVSYTATIGSECSDWIKESTKTRALETTTKVYTISPNEEVEKREGTITFTDGTLSETVHVYQSGGPIILLTQNNYVVDQKGETITVELRSNCDYEVIMPSVDWISENTTRAMSSHTLYYKIKENTTYDSREARIIYKANNVRDTLTITQAQLNAVILVNKSLSVGYKGGTISAKVKSNVDYEVEIPSIASWISRVLETRALSESTLKFNVSENSEYEVRSTNIYLKSSDGLRDTLSVTQSGFSTIVNVKNIGTFSQLYESLGKPERIKIVGNVYLSELQSTLSSSTYGKAPCSYCDLSETIIYDSNGDRIDSMPSITAEPVTSMYHGQRFCHNKMETIVVPNYMTAVDASAFASYYSLQTVILPSSITSIGEAAFVGCSKLSSVNIPEGVKTISGNAFNNCSALSEISLPKSLVSIEKSAFNGCSALKTISIPNSVTSIGSFAFYGCSDCA